MKLRLSFALLAAALLSTSLSAQELELRGLDSQKSAPADGDQDLPSLVPS